ncbi:SbcC/MukB-like Walker B domain-containing protein [Quadrisphaera sp. INWT6]|uniref:SbcC/MukB-like Walker B domain-containing protein n=1 Tax=Quadrisphaera sp. INWT6 TaxID=2596917 RepID=UPI0018927958|nr:SbcC/MukB-like Walker B domain-containing protein [Quadrisphaera sp. INWT6]MBF5082851.1 SMC family ATPase [Quadrisphaera sp. INWT6]
MSQLAGAVRAAATSAEAQRASAAAAARAAQTREHAAQTAADRAQRLADLHARRSALLAAAPSVAAQRTELVAAAAAAGLSGHLHAVRAAGTALREATARAGAAAAHLAEVAGETPGQASGKASGEASAATSAQEPPTSQDLRERAAAHRREQGRLSELVALESDLAARQRQAREVAAEHERVHALQQQVAAEREQHALQRVELAEQLAGSTDLAVLAPAAADALHEAEAVLDHARAADALETRRASAAQGSHDAAQAALEARAGWLDARQRRLDGVAAELAARLRPGAACPVCGACEHPAPAAPEGPDSSGSASGSGAAAAEDAAQQRWDRAEAAARTAQQRLDDLQREVAAARARAGDLGTEQAAARVEELRARAAAASSAAALVGSLRARLADVEAADAAAVRTQEQVVASLARLGERAEQLAAGLAHDSERLERARDGEEGLTARSARLAALADAAEQLAAASEAEASALRAEEAAREAASAAAVSGGFADLESAALAERPAGERRRLEEAVAEHERAGARVQAQLEELGAAVAEGPGAGPAVGTAEALVGARREREEADAAADTALRAAERASSASQVLERLVVQAEQGAAAARPLAAAAEVAGDLARCAEGTGGGNTRRMKLSTFVLAARLEQVAVSASERLEVMSDGRYRLVHTDALERRGAGSGLGLRVLDAWTGVERDVATLSGGETFMASLALALGLADVVRAEGGGTPVETLFVDEGFGTLDPESLEEVMGVLEQLRAGGRAVGLVSHVPELRTRVPARLEVQRTAAGSRLRTVLG